MVGKTRYGSGDADRFVGGAESDLPLVKEVLASAKQIRYKVTHDDLQRDVSTKPVVDELHDNTTHCDLYLCIIHIC